jgi:predicted oxidoreductase
MSEFERGDRMEREPTVEDVRQLMGASAPHFALQIRNRIRNLIGGLDTDHPARVLGEQEMARLERLAVDGEHRGASVPGEPELPSIRRA